MATANLEIKVSSENLRNSATDVQSFCKAFYELMERLAQEMRNMKIKVWEGEAAEAFDNHFKVLEGKVNSYKKVIEDYEAFLRKAADDYAKTEGQTTQEIDSLLTDLNKLFG